MISLCVFLSLSYDMSEKGARSRQELYRKQSSQKKEGSSSLERRGKK